MKKGLLDIQKELFQFRNNCINYGVIAHESDHKDAIKAWTLQRR